MSPENFASSLRQRIRARHGGGLPSASELARSLNEADEWRRPVSTETMRRWIRGLSLPELHRVPVLCEWLECTPLELFTIEPAEDGPDAAAQTLPAVAGRRAAAPAAAAAERGQTHEVRDRVIRALSRLNLAELKALVLLLERRAK